MNYCCTTPLPSTGVGNISSEPLFVNRGAGDLHLQTNSPCINTGSNPSVSGAFDLDGRPRIVDATVDMGAYEFQGPVMSLFIAWLQEYGLSTDASADYSDFDNDQMNSWQEWVCGTCPTNSMSALRLLTPAAGPSGVNVTWQSVTNRVYLIARGRDLGANPPFAVLASNIIGQSGTTTFTDTNAPVVGSALYRVGVQP